MKLSPKILAFFALSSAFTPFTSGEEDDENYQVCKEKVCYSKDGGEAIEPIEDLDAYYAPVSDLSGASLRSALNEMVVNHIRYSYDCVWSALADTDQDPNNPDHVIALYTQRSIPVLRRDCGANDGDSWNREHVWAKSHGFPKSGEHAYTDIHHLRPADRSVNGDRSNFDFKEGGDDHHECKGCKIDRKNKTWEPSDASKGQVARMLFYMDIRYEGGADDKSGTPDLSLTDEPTGGKKDPTLGRLSDLLKWHCKFPVTDEERKRNDKIYMWQKNRNPFIDRPEFVGIVYGVTCEELLSASDEL